MKRERRIFDFELRADGDSPKLVGHAAVFNRVADLYYFKEQVAPGCFADTIQADDIRALFNHDANYVLGRNRAGTLSLSEDDQGLAVEILPPDTQFARDLMTSMKRGDITQMSFGFTTIEDKWDRPTNTRTLLKVQLYDVSPVTFPAYADTDVSARSAEDVWKEFARHSASDPLNEMRRRTVDLLRQYLPVSR